VVEIDLDCPERGIQNERVFWSPSLSEKYAGSLEDSIEETKELVDDAVKIRLQADVRVGIALSGGLDSSIIATQAAEKYGLFSAVSPDLAGDESFFARMMGDHLRIPINEFQLQEQDIFESLCRCLNFSDGPLVSFAGVIFSGLMGFARDTGFKVVLTGQGADEAFCGYRKYSILEVRNRLKEAGVSGATKFLLESLVNSHAFRGFSFTEAKRYIGFKSSFLGESILDLQEPLQANTLNEFQWLDIKSLSVPYLCHYEDRMSMSNSVEVRSPFLDYRVIELGLRMSSYYKLYRGWSKYPLRRAYEHLLPYDIAWRKDKKGFTNPQDYWLKVKLRAAVVDIMSSQDCHVYSFGLVDRKKYLGAFESYCAGRPDIWFREVFGPFCLELWFREFAKKAVRG
jgi:asparagine synthase (glutamine-hydrolysing)